jgi:heme iron utilization protein
VTGQGKFRAIAVASKEPRVAEPEAKPTGIGDAAALPGFMPGRLPETAPPADFDATAVAKCLLRSARAGALATIDRNTGHPFASLVNVATDVDGSPLILISRLSTHTANLENDARASILLAAVGRGDPLAHPRLTVLGAFKPVARDDAQEPRLRRRFLARHPKSELYAGFADFAFWRLAVVSAHLNAGFARAADLKSAELIIDVNGAGDLIEAEAGAIAHMNADHQDAVRRYATKLCGAEDGPWRLCGIDPEGVDLALGDATLRLPFPQPVATAADLRRILVNFSTQAREE